MIKKVKLNNLEKFVLLALSALAVATCPARADLGDTIASSQEKYGEPKQGIFQHEVDFINNGWAIEEYFNDSGICVSVNFIPLDGSPITKKIRSLMDGRNIPPALLNPNGNGWTHKKWEDDVSAKNATAYTWTNGNYYLLVVDEQVKRGDAWYYSRMYVTPEGGQILKADVQAYQEGQKQTVDEKPEEKITPTPSKVGGHIT